MNMQSEQTKKEMQSIDSRLHLFLIYCQEYIDVPTQDTYLPKKFQHEEDEKYPGINLHTKKTTEARSSFPIYFGAFPTYCVISTFNACAKRIPYS